jgi:excisionase family DNA binding protein
MKTPDTSRNAAPTLALTRKQAARALGVSAMTIDRLTQKGVLNPSRATRRPLFAITELERFLADTAARSPREKQSLAVSTSAASQSEGK